MSISEIARQTEALGVSCQEQVPMSQRTSFRIGGPAELMLFPASPAELRSCLSLCRAAGEKPFILGNGSNLLVKDSGLDGVVVAMEGLRGIELLEGCRIRCAAGEKLSELCLYAQKNGLAGLEFAYGIPGSAGGAVFMNAGAYGGEMKDVLLDVEYIDAQGEFSSLRASELGLSYRHSAFMENGGTVTALTVRLRPGDPGEIRTMMDDIMGRRREKQPLEFPSAGSVFKRPEGQFAGALIEQCGLKGRRVGDAQVSEKHAGFIVNRGEAMARDVRALIALVQTVVEDETGVFLEPEIKFI